MREIGSTKERSGRVLFYVRWECVCVFYVTGLIVKKDLTGKEPFEQRPEETLVS